MSDSTVRSDDQSAAEAGIIYGVLGIIATVAYPLYYSLVTYESTAFPSNKGLFLTLAGACVAVWGASVYRTGRLRSLTLERALLIPVCILAVGVMIDVLTVGRIARILASVNRIDTTIDSLYDALPSVIFGASIFPLLGTAIRQRRIRWIGGAVALILAVFVIASSPISQGMPVVITVIGLPCAVFGYIVGAPPSTDSAQ